MQINFAGINPVNAMSAFLRQAMAELIAVRLNLAEFGLVFGLILQIALLHGNLISSIIISDSK